MPKIRKNTNKNEKEKSLALPSFFDNPEKHFISLREAVNRLFDESFLTPFDSFNFISDKSFAAFPKADLVETDKEFKVVAEVPGVKAEDVSVDVDEKEVVISGRISQEEEEKDKKYYRLERRYGEFSRSFALPDKIEVDKVSAEMKDGVLTVVLPKVKTTKRKKVKVSAKK